jgi:hypothetical protein
VAAWVALAGLACLGLAACSPGADYPSLFPSVHDVPPPRNDSRLDQNQVQQATEDLITARDRLTAEAQGARAKSATGSKPAAKSPQSPAKSAASSPGKSSASKSSTGKSSTGKSSGNSSAGAIQASGRQMLGPDAGQAAGGAETK